MCVTSPTTVDLKVHRSGVGFFLFEPLTSSGRQFLRDRTAHSSWQWIGGRLAIDDRRLAMELAQGALDDGLRVE